MTLPMLVIGVILLVQLFFTSCTPIPAGTPPSSPARSKSSSPSGSRSRSRSPEESVQTSIQHYEPPSTAPHPLPHPLRLSQAPPASRIRFLQRSQSARLEPFPSRLGPGRSAFAPYSHPTSQSRTPYQRSLSDPHQGLQSIKEDHDPSLDLRLSIGQSSSASSSSSPSNIDTGHKRPKHEQTEEDSLGESSKKPKLDHSASFQDSSTSMSPQEMFDPTARNSLRRSDQHDSLGIDSTGTSQLQMTSTRPGQTSQTHDAAHNVAAPPSDHLIAAGGEVTEPRHANEPSDAEVDQFYAIMRNVRNLREEARARGMPWPPIPGRSGRSPHRGPHFGNPRHRGSGNSGPDHAAGA